jgi:hypothetical protein
MVNQHIAKRGIDFQLEYPHRNRNGHVKAPAKSPTIDDATVADVVADLIGKKLTGSTRL